MPISLEIQRYVKAVIYGEGGSGKTRFCADAPDPWWFDWENSTETLLHWPEFKDIALNRVTIFPDPFVVADKVRQLARDPNTKTVVLDSETSALFQFMEEYMEKAGRKDEYKRADTDYGYATNVFNKLLSMLTRAKINVVIICHERFEYSGERDDRTISRIYPDVTPAIGKSMARLTNVVGYLQARPGTSNRSAERKLYLNPTSLIVAKNRLNIQETFITNPTWKDVFGNVI